MALPGRNTASRPLDRQIKPEYLQELHQHRLADQPRLMTQHALKEQECHQQADSNQSTCTITVFMSLCVHY